MSRQQLIERIKQLSPQQQAMLLARVDKGSEPDLQAEKKVLAAFVIPAKNHEIDVEQLKTALHQTLPDYMIPSSFTLLESFPQLPNGKVDHSALTIGRLKPKTKLAMPVTDNELEQQLKEIWCKVLQTDFIELEDNFFEIGGDSILSMQIVSLAHQQNIDLKLTDLFEFPSIIQLATQLQLRKTESNKESIQTSTDDTLLPPTDEFNHIPGTRLIPIRQTGNKTPFFMLQGSSLIASILVKQLDKQQPFYLLDSYWSDAKIGLNATIERLASAYIKDIRSIQAKGPYQIAGYSIGAVIVFEIAQQLMQQGEKIDLLFLLDPPADPMVFKNIAGYIENKIDITPSESSREITKVSSAFIAKFKSKQRALLRYIKAGRLLYEVKLYASYFFKKIARKLNVQWQNRIVIPVKRAIAHNYFVRGKEVPVSLRDLYVENAYFVICKRYEAQAYNGSIVLFTTENFPEYSLWDNLATEKNQQLRFNYKHLELTLRTEAIHHWIAELIKFIK